MIIEIFDADNCAESEHLLAALKRVVTFHRVASAKIYVTPRQADGWIEYIVNVTFAPAGQNGGMTVGVLQRKPGEPVEYHS